MTSWEEGVVFAWFYDLAGTASELHPVGDRTERQPLKIHSTAPLRGRFQWNPGLTVMEGALKHNLTAFLKQTLKL